MKSTVDILEERISAAMAKASGQTGCPAVVRPATDPKFGDYQANGVMALAKQIKTNPRKLAESVVPLLDLSDLCEPPEVAGPGFINLRLKPQYVAAELLRVAGEDGERVGIQEAASPQTVVVDFSSPNVAKQMHVGHLRSTIIGDCLCRLLEFEGHKVIRQNHIGDWGTQFGMLIRYMYQNVEMKTRGDTTIVTSVVTFGDMEQFYREAKRLFDTDPKFAEESRQYVVRLQSGDKTALDDWKQICILSLTECQTVYERLAVQLTLNDVRGESFYNDKLPAVVADLKKAGLAVESDGAICVFPPGFKTKEGEPLPFIIQKSDGAFLYATTDLAALRHRVNELKADRIVYVTDARQIQHFQMLFKVAEMAGWDVRDGRKIELVHVTFGSVMGEDGKPLKTRSGENVKLKELLDEAVERAKTVVEEKNPELPAEKKLEIAQAVGIGAVKYADYSNSRTSDYVFSFGKMLAMDGNTAPYMQYAYARVRSIERKAQSRGVDVQGELQSARTLNLNDPSELDLAKHLVRYAEAVESAIGDYRPNYLTAYLYELAQKFSGFYANCPVLDAPPESRPTRLLLCDQTARTIRHGLSSLLGIAVVEQM
ncbi:MAG TPA: arginine--tRNA ligase [Sedimentisphaerales bacterium]|nr:arginine--tRNA ligase [Sedimentisphaerales bacterium]